MALTLSKNDDRRDAKVTFIATTSSSFKLHLLRRRMPLEDNTNLAHASKSHSQTQRAAVSLHPGQTAVCSIFNTRTVHTTRPRVEPRGYRKQPYPCHERLLAVSRRISTRSPRQSMESGRICWYVLSQEIPRRFACLRHSMCHEGSSASKKHISANCNMQMIIVDPC
jgi:hypothetical protein